MSKHDTLILLSVILAVVVIAVLAVALILVRQGLTRISQGLATLAGALESVESEHLKTLAPVKREDACAYLKAKRDELWAKK